MEGWTPPKDAVVSKEKVKFTPPADAVVTEPIKPPTEKEVEQASVVWSNLNKETPKFTEKKVESPNAVLEAQMTKDLLANRDNDVYQQNYIATLEKKGYDKESLLGFRKRIMLENPVAPELTSEEFREIARKNNIKTGQPEMPFIQPILDWAEDFMVKTGEAIGVGAEKGKEGASEVLASLGSQTGTISDKAYEVTRGGLKASIGTAGVAFNVIPAAVTFNAGMDAINTTAKKNLSEENAKSVEEATALPFTLFTKLTGALGIQPEEGSNLAMASELFDLILAGKAIHATVGGKKKVSDKINSLAELKDMSKKASENQLNETQLKEYKDFVEELKTITAEDIKKVAIGKNTPESLEIAKKIEELQQPTIGETADGLPRVIPPTAEKLAEAEKLKEDALTTFEEGADGIPRVIKPTQEQINLAFKEKFQEQSKTVFEAIKEGEVAVEKLKTSLDFAKEKGKITPQEHASAIQKIDTYLKYEETTKDVHITDEAKRNVFDLTDTNENLKAQMESIESQIKSDPSNPLLKSKLKSLENIYNDNQKQIDSHLTSGIADQMGAVSTKTQEKVQNNKVTSDSEFTQAEKDWAKNPTNAKAVKAVIGEGKTHEAFKQEAKKQFWKQQPENIAKAEKMFDAEKEISDKVFEAELERQWKETQKKGSTIPEIKSNPPTAEHKDLHDAIATKLPGKDFNNLSEANNNSGKADIVVEHMLEKGIRVLKGGVVEVGNWAKKVGVKGNLLPQYYDVDFGGKKIKFASNEHTVGMKERNLQGRKVDVQLVLPEDVNLGELVKEKVIDKHELVEVDGKPAGFKFEGSKEVYPHILVVREVMPDGTTGKKLANLASSDFSEFLKKKTGREGARSKKPVVKEDIANPPKENVVDNKKVDVEEQGLERDLDAESEGAKVPTIEERDAGFTATEESKIENELLTEHKLYEDEQENREIIEQFPDKDVNEQEPIVKAIEEKEIPTSNEVRNEQVEVIEQIEKEQKKIAKGQLNFQLAKAMKHDVVSAYDQVLQYFIKGGKIKAEAIKELFGGEGKDNAVKSESKLREGYIDKTPLKKSTDKAVDGLAHDLWQSQKIEGQFDTADFRNAIEEAVTDFNTRTEMAKHLNESFEKKDTRSVDTSKENDITDSDVKKSDNKLDDEGVVYQKEKKEASPDTIKAREKKIALLKKAIKGIEVVHDESIGKDIAGQLDADGKTIRLNPKYNYADTPIHEFGHALIDIMGGTKNSLIKKGTDQLRNTELWKETAERYPELPPDMLAKEVLAEAIGREGAKIFETKEAQSKFKNFLDGLFYKIKRVLGIEKGVAKELANRLLKGEKIAEVKSKGTGEVQMAKTRPTDDYEYSRQLKGAKLANTKYNVSNKISDAKGFTRDLFELVSTTLNNIHPTLKGAVRNYQLDLKTSMDKDLAPAKDFLTKVKSMNKMSKADFSDFDFARKNGDTKKINELVKKYGMEAEYKKMNEAIEALDKRAEELDLPTNFKVGDAPVRVKDYKGLMKYVEKELGTDAKSIKEEAEIREAYLERPMTEEEMGEFASEILRKRATKNVPYITPEMEKFYDSADDALINYITSMNLKIATREFAGISDAQVGFETSTGTMWKKANELLSKGEITPDQYKQVTEVINAYFNKGEANKAMTMLKNIGFIDVMGNVSSALGQIGDIGFAMYKFGPLTTGKEFIKSIGGKSEIKAKDVVADDILSEYGHSGLNSQKVVKSVFKWAGLEKMEKLSNETIVNSHIAKMRKDAMRLDKMGKYDKKAFMDKIEGVFEPAEVKQVIKDLISGKKTDNVIRLAYNGILDLKPIGKSEVPLKYLENPNGRVMYSLKLYTLKSIDILRNEIGKDLASKDKVRIARGTKNLILLSSSLALMGGTMDEIRDYIGNKKKMSLSDRIFYSYLKTIGINSYMVGSAKREGLASVMAKQITPSIITQPIKILQDIYDDVNGAHKGKTLTHLPIFGKILYENLNDKK